ncbi:MAG: crossover junction endodeoxyribonuclease RuvC, partial [Clostridia bacterium]
MIVLGIDPGYARVGYGVVDYTKNKYRALEYGSITTNADEPLPKRLNKIEKELRKIVSRYKIDSSSIEDLYFNT